MKVHIEQTKGIFGFSSFVGNTLVVGYQTSKYILLLYKKQHVVTFGFCPLWKGNELS